MEHVIHRLVIGLTATIVAMSLFLSPANAVAMIDCEVLQTSLEADLIGHGDHVNHAAAKQDQGDAGHVSEHCAAHACVVATETGANTSVFVFVVQSAELNTPNGSLVPLSVPKGLRRPPRF